MENSKTVDVLNDLLQIINDRIEGFKDVNREMIESHSSLKEEYDCMVENSTGMRVELTSLIEERGGDLNNTTTIPGVLHRAWIEVKNSLTFNKKESTLQNVIFGENAAISAYEKALESGDLDGESSKVVQNQLQELKSSYNKFVSLEKNTDQTKIFSR
jgi:uncharacterized protein (TIGR02284 family)